MATKFSAPPKPPRLTGDYKADVVSLNNWLWAFFSTTVLESGLLDPAFQSNAGIFDPAHLPDPSATSIAKAQDTANHAYAGVTRAALFEGNATLADPNNVLTFTLATPMPNANYHVIPVPAGFTGSPGASAFIPISITKTAASFTITFAAAPGGGNTVTFDLIVLPSAS